MTYLSKPGKGKTAKQRKVALYGSLEDVCAIVWAERPHECERCPKGLVWAPEGEPDPIGYPAVFHHIVKKSQGGKDVPENMEILCVECHDRHHRER